jgi:hypothetical protein
MTIEEQRSELKSQIAYRQRELEHFRDLPAKNIFEFMQNSEKLVLSLIASLHQQLSNLSVYPHVSANGLPSKSLGRC